MKSIYQTIQKHLDLRDPFAVATLVESKGSTPRKAGAKMLVFADGSSEGTIGGGPLEKKIIDEARVMIAHGDTRLFQFDLGEGEQGELNAVCGGSVQVFVETMQPAARLIVLGAGHVGRVLARMAAELNFHLLIYDNRPEFLAPDFFPQETELICGDFSDAMDRLHPGEGDYIVIMTYDHQYDEEALYHALQKTVKYLGVIASKRKMVTFREHLLRKGITEAQLEQVHAPIGLPIGGKSPAEIAVSILAEIVQVMNRKD